MTIPTTPAGPAAVAEADQMVARLERLIIASSLEEIAYALLNLATMHVLVQADDPQSEWAQLTRLVRDASRLADAAIYFADQLSTNKTARHQQKEQ